MQDYSDASFDLSGAVGGGRSSSRSPNNGSSSTGDLLGGINTSTKDPHAADKYTKRTSSSKRSTSDRRKSRRSSSNKYSTSGGNSSSSSSSKLNYTDSNKNNNNNTSLSTMGKYSDDPNASNDMTRSSVTSYADSKYVKQPPTPPTPTTTNDEINALLQGGSHDPDDPLASPGDVDKDAVFRDEFEDELDEIEMEMREDKRRNLNRFTTSNSERRTGLSKLAFYLRVYAIPLLMGLLFLVGLAAGILYLMGFGKSKDNGVQKYLQAVPVAPATLKLMCETTDLDGSSANTFQVPALCHDACAKAECCWNTAANSPYVCTTDTQNQCPPYKDECSQHQEFIGTTLPPQANNNNNNGGGGPPVTTNDDDEMMVPEFPSRLRDACKVTGLEASTECKAGCAAASCCWDDQTTVLCSTDTVTNCGDYKDACDFLNDPDTSSGNGSGMDIIKTWSFPDAPQGLSVYCDPGEMEEISLHICEDKCNEAECCWKDGTESCVSTYPAEACHDYTQACSILNNLNTAPGNSHDVTAETAPTTSSASDVPEAPSNLADTCSQDRIANSEKGGEALIACEQDCLRASCCWQPNVDSPCTDNGFCSAYESPCSIFKSLFGKPDDYDPKSETLAPIISQVPQASSQIDLTCNPDVLKPSVDSGKFIVECEKECLKGACCWKENHPTICPDASECAAYETPCGDHLVEALLSLETGGSGGSPPAPVPAPTTLRPTVAPPTTMAPLVQNNVPEAAGDISMICNADVLKLSVSDGQFIVQCEKECLEGACCWKENHSTICPDASQCASYEPCKDHLVPALEEIEGVNHGLNLASTSSSNTNIPEVPSDMNLRCSLANLNDNINGRAFCEEICNQALCCWNEQEADSCTENSVCSGYANCANLLTTSPISGSGTGNAPPTPPSDLASTCSAGNIIDLRGLEQCRQECDQAECCWLEDTEFGSCVDNADCETYRTDCSLMRKELNLSGSNRRRMLRLG